MNKVMIISLECTGDNAVIQAAIEEFKRAVECFEPPSSPLECFEPPSSPPEPPAAPVVLGPGGDFTREVLAREAAIDRVKRGDAAWMSAAEQESALLMAVIESASAQELNEAFLDAVKHAEPTTLRRMRSMAARFGTKKDAAKHGPLMRSIAHRIVSIRRGNARVVPVDVPEHASEPARGME